MRVEYEVVQRPTLASITSHDAIQEFSAVCTYIQYQDYSHLISTLDPHTVVSTLEVARLSQGMYVLYVCITHEGKSKAEALLI